MLDLTKVHRDRCDEVAGDLVAGKFLHKLIRWQNYTKVVRDGHKWTTLTHAEWAKETSLTVHQIRRALTRLGAADLIIREQHMFKNRAVMFVRLSAACIETLYISQLAQNCAGQARLMRSWRSPWLTGST
jgi:hypothetical protein